MFPILSGQNRKEKKKANQPLIYIQMRNIQGKLDFSFISQNEFPGGRSYCIVSSCGVNIQLRASGTILHYKHLQELLHLLAIERNDNFHFCPDVQTIPPRPFKTFFSHFNLHMKGNNISKEFCFKFKWKTCLCLMSFMSTNRLILYLEASQPEDNPSVSVIEFSVFIYQWKIQQPTYPY